MSGLENKDSLFHFQTALSLAGIITVKLLKIYIYKVWWRLISDVTQYGCLSLLIIQDCTVLMWKGWKRLISDVTQYGCLSLLIIQDCTVLMWKGWKLKSHGGGPHISWFVSPVHRPPSRYPLFSTGTVVTLWKNDLKFVATKQKEWGTSSFI